MSQNGVNTLTGEFRWKKKFGRIAVKALLLVLLVGVATTAVAEPPTTSVLAAEPLLSTSITLSVDQQPVGKLMRQILASVSPAVAAEIQDRPMPIRSLWVDRRIDLDVRVNLSEAATPAARVLLELAQRQSLAVFPLPGVLLVGRDDWVDSTIGQLAAGETRTDDLISIQWPTGSTASEVLALILVAPKMGIDKQAATDLAAVLPAPDAAGGAGFAPAWVPHDVWVAGSFSDVDRVLAVGLLLAQFDCALKPGTRLETLRGSATLPAGVQRWSELPPAQAFALKYPTGDSAKAIRESLSSARPRATIRVSERHLLINSTAENHRRAIAVHWRVTSQQRAKVAPIVNDTKAVFELKLINQPAAVVLRQLANAAGKTLRIETNAELASEQLISLDAQQKTLQELAVIVAASAGLRIRWSQHEVVVSK